MKIEPTGNRTADEVNSENTLMAVTYTLIVSECWAGGVQVPYGAGSTGTGEIH